MDSFIAGACGKHHNQNMVNCVLCAIEKSEENLKNIFMETKMKRIPFDLERAKKGEAFRMYSNDEYDTFYIGELDGEIFFWWLENGFKKVERSKPKEMWYHLIPDEPKPERWAVVEKRHLYMFVKKDAAIKAKADRDNYTVVKLADDEN